MRTVRSFDPCLPCGVHMYLGGGQKLERMHSPTQYVARVAADDAVSRARRSTRIDLQATGERINTLLEASAAGGVVARERAEELVRLVADLYGAGLERVLTILHESGRLDDDVLAALAADDLVASLLLVHDLHPYDVDDPGRAGPGQRAALPRLATAATSSCSGSATTAWSGSGCSAAATAARRPRSPSSWPSRERSRPPPRRSSASRWRRRPTATGAAGPVISVDSLWSRLDRATQPMRTDGGTALLAAGPGAGRAGRRRGRQLRGRPDRDRGLPARLRPLRLPRPLRSVRSRAGRCDPGRLLGGAIGDAALRCPACGAHFAGTPGRRLPGTAGAAPRPAAAAGRSGRRLGRRARLGGGMTTASTLGGVCHWPVCAGSSATRPPPVAGERCEMCAEPIADGAPARGGPGEPRPDVHLPGCYLLFTAEDAELRYRAVPDRYLSFPDFDLDARQYDELEIPVSLAFLFHNSVLDRVVAFYPGPGRRDRVRAAAGGLDPDRRGQPRAGAAAARRRGAADPRRRTAAERVLLPSGADRRLLRAGRPAPPAVAGLRRRLGGARRRWRSSSPRSPPRSRPAPRDPGATVR